jgi:AmmeMemoRadiSam system protein A
MSMAFTITEEEKELLLAEARETIAAKLEKRQPRYRTGEIPGSALATPCGAFVTLHIEDKPGEKKTGAPGRLRGCIGRMTAGLPLRETVHVMAVEAAFGDPRFPPLQREELPRCHIEISALSPLEECPDPSTVQVGVHGLYLIYRGRAGVLLPQVPVEQGWDRQQYLDYICIKAGLPPRSYEAPGAELLTFTAVVFGE